MSSARLGMNVIELIFMYFILGIGAVFGQGLCSLIGLHGLIDIIIDVLCAIGFAVLLVTWARADAQYEGRAQRRVILQTARQALRSALAERGIEPTLVEEEVNRRLPTDLAPL